MKHQASCKSSNFRRYFVFVMIFSLFMVSSCIHYSFSGASIPEGVNSIFIPFFADQSGGNVSDLSSRLNQALVDRFINQTSLNLADNRQAADAVMEGSIVAYSNSPFSVTGNDRADQNQVKINVHATFQFTGKEGTEFNKTFNGASTYDPNNDPIQGENNAAQEALEQIANNMFNDAVSGW